VVQLHDYRKQIAGIRSEMRTLQAAVEPEEVKDYVFTALDGQVTLSALFGDKPDLFVIHNMGKSCPACTMWADGYNGVLAHLESRAAFVVTTPDDPQTQQEFAASRGWRFRMVSHEIRILPPIWAIAAKKGFSPVFQCSVRKTGGFCACPIPGSGLAMIFARSFISSICCRKGRPAGV
jgi:peroxiredoxin